jgi:hypothetical protein
MAADDPPLAALLRRSVDGDTRGGRGGSRDAAQTSVEADCALAAMACTTHLKHTTGSIITVDAGRHL